MSLPGIEYVGTYLCDCKKSLWNIQQTLSNDKILPHEPVCEFIDFDINLPNGGGTHCSAFDHFWSFSTSLYGCGCVFFRLYRRISIWRIRETRQPLQHIRELASFQCILPDSETTPYFRIFGRAFSCPRSHQWRTTRLHFLHLDVLPRKIFVSYFESLILFFSLQDNAWICNGGISDFWSWGPIFCFVFGFYSNVHIHVGCSAGIRRFSHKQHDYINYMEYCLHGKTLLLILNFWLENRFWWLWFYWICSLLYWRDTSGRLLRKEMKKKLVSWIF